MTNHENGGTMILRSTVTSPFGRKARMAFHVLGLENRMVLQPADTLDPADDLRTQNPLGKMPTLLLGDGSVLFDSRTILSYLDRLAGGGLLYPIGAWDRALVETAEVLHDGITEAALLMVYEGRFREPGTHSRRWLDHQGGKIRRALDRVAAAPPSLSPSSGKTNAAAIALVCALGYLDWRRPFPWRDGYPELVVWLDRITRRDPAVAATANPEVPPI
ncbi:MAG: glutathione S-transferase N-terminal domain-containing protein [Rhodospirillum sp.]|nr:glutathione S-transferase N-terminal domain-containing protein [Rhodospirillum sp.]MCF8488413.1 glutathione S-transferase N-terminal domain-containing protein [Rhodospirillum sp.]